MWLETDAARTLRRVFDELSARAESADIMALATNFQNHISRMGECLAVSEALQIQGRSPLIAFLRCPYRNRWDGGHDKSDGSFAHRRAVCSGADKSSARFIARTQRLNPTSLGKIIQSTNPLRLETLYTGVILPRKIIEEIEFVRDRLEFEFRIEGKVVTPLWFQSELVALGYVRFLAEATSAILEEVENTFGNEIRQQLEAQNHLLVAELVQRGLETCQKLSSHFAKFKSWHEDYSLLNRSAEYDWPKIDWDGFEKRIVALRQSLVTALAKSSAELAKLPTVESWPDFFGHAYTVLSEECFTAMAYGNKELFGVVFPAFFQLALEANERLRQKFFRDTRNIQ